jgi:hypothetical protein
MTGFDIISGGLGLLAALWCIGLSACAIISERNRTAALMKNRLEDLAVRLRGLGDEMRRANVSL